MERLFSAYHEELLFIRGLLGDHAAEHSKLATRLQLTAGEIKDPHIARLVEAFALLAARTRVRVDDDFELLATSLLDILYPHFLAPIPSMALMACSPRPDGTALVSLPAGARVETDRVSGIACEYRTAWSLEIGPFELKHASISGLPFQAPKNVKADDAQGVVHLMLETTQAEVTFKSLGLDKICLYLAGDQRVALSILELLCTNVTSVAICESPDDRNPIILGKEQIRLMGLEPAEVVLPIPSRSLPAHGLLTEIFAFPEKFRLIEITGLDAKTRASCGRRLHLFLYLNVSPGRLEQLVDETSFSLFTVPVVNLFEQRAEPIRLDHTRTDYRLVADARRELGVEVQTVKAVFATDADGTVRPYRPLFDLGSADNGDTHGRHWLAERRDHPALPGDDVHLSFVDLAMDPVQAEDEVVTVETLCTNRDMPSRLSYEAPLRILGGGAAIKSARFLTKPTEPRRAKRDGKACWQLVSHLGLNHDLLSAEEDGSGILQMMLRLYDRHESSAAIRLIDRIKCVHVERGFARVPLAGPVAFASGNHVTLEVEDDRLSGSGLYPLLMVIDRFLAGQATVNTFSQLTVKLAHKDEILIRCPARSGTTALL